MKYVGDFPHDHDRLIPLLASQVLHGRKVIIFPEGGAWSKTAVLWIIKAITIFTHDSLANDVSNTLVRRLLDHRKYNQDFKLELETPENHLR